MEDKSDNYSLGPYLHYKLIFITMTRDDWSTPSYNQGNLAVETLQLTGPFVAQTWRKKRKIKIWMKFRQEYEITVTCLKLYLNVNWVDFHFVCGVEHKICASLYKLILVKRSFHLISLSKVPFKINTYPIIGWAQVCCAVSWKLA